jgi:type III secretory pathway component EscR
MSMVDEELNVMKTIYLVQAEIEQRDYMVDKPKTFKDLRIVMAVSQEMADMKYREFWDKKNDPYNVSYFVYIESIKEAID